MSGQLAQARAVSAIGAVIIGLQAGTKRGAVIVPSSEQLVLRRGCVSRTPFQSAGLASGLVSAWRARRAITRLAAARSAAAAVGTHLLRHRRSNSWQANKLLQRTGSAARRAFTRWPAAEQHVVRQQGEQTCRS